MYKNGTLYVYHVYGGLGILETVSSLSFCQSSGDQMMQKPRFLISGTLILVLHTLNFAHVNFPNIC